LPLTHTPHVKHDSAGKTNATKLYTVFHSLNIKIVHTLKSFPYLDTITRPDIESYLKHYPLPSMAVCLIKPVKLMFTGKVGILRK